MYTADANAAPVSLAGESLVAALWGATAARRTHSVRTSLTQEAPMTGLAPSPLSSTPTADQMPTDTLLASKDETIANLSAEITYLRDQLDCRSRELAAERARVEGPHHDSPARLSRPVTGASTKTLPAASPPTQGATEPARLRPGTFVAGPPAWRRPPVPTPPRPARVLWRFWRRD